MADETITTSDDGSQVVANEAETTTAGASLVTGGPSPEFQQYAAQQAAGEDIARDTETDDGAGGTTEDTTSETGKPSFDADGLRLQQLQQTARSFNVPEQHVGAWQNAGEAQSYLTALQHAMAQQAVAPQQQGGNGQQPNGFAPLPGLDFQLGDEMDTPFRDAFGKVDAFRGNVNERFKTYESVMEQFATHLYRQQQESQRALAMQKASMVENQIGTLPKELNDFFGDKNARDMLQQHIQMAEAGAVAMGNPNPDYSGLIQQAVWAVAGPKMAEIERNRLATEQKKKAKGVSPGPSAAKTTSRDEPSGNQSFAKFSAAHARVARELDG